MDLRFVIEGLVLLFGSGIAWGIFKNAVDNLKGENTEQWLVVTKLRDWVQIHEKDEASIRLDLERELGRMREASGKAEVELHEMVTVLKSVRDKFDKFIDGNMFNMHEFELHKKVCKHYEPKE